MEKHFLKVESLSKRYKKCNVYAVEDVSFNIDEGAVFGLLGPNGAGKTTILNIISGLFEPSSGIFSSDILTSETRLLEVMGVSPQVPALYEELTARENMVFFGRIYSVKGKELDKRIEILLEKVGLDDKADILVKKFSTGMKQRLNLGIALISSPSFLLLDEPTAGVDPQSRNRIFEIISQFKADGGTMIYTTHYMEEAERLCDRVAIIDKGKLLVIGTPDELIRKYGALQLTINIKKSEKREYIIDKISSLNGITYVKDHDKLLDIRIRKDQSSDLILDEFTHVLKKIDDSIFLKSFREPSIETVFLELTGTELRDEL